MHKLPAVIAGLSAVCLGCVHWDSERNAPGHIDVLRRPAVIECERQEQPADPGEHVINFFPTVYLGGGAFGVGSGDAEPATALGVETSLLFGSIDASHHEDSERGVLLRDGLGLNWGIYSFSRTERMVSYGELLFRRRALNLSPGWAWNWQAGRHGPQLTISMMLVYVRATRLIGDATDLSFGIYLGPVLAWLWSR